jgi:hypothetical protein
MKDYRRYKKLRENGETVDFFSQESKFDDAFDLDDSKCCREWKREGSSLPGR